jgi:DNA-binding NtrC family response regulator
MTEKKILFIDDNVNILNSYGRAFRNNPWQCFFAQSGPEALRLLKEHAVDMVVTDIKMPEMHGIELIAKIRKEFRTKPIIVISGYPKIKDDPELTFHDVAAFLEKPVDVDVLKKTLAGLLSDSS